jgi:AGZA family xanthine/uracil permease-like MFS transporter
VSSRPLVTSFRPGWGAFLDRCFQISERGSSIRTEVIAGVATWLTMSYILFVNPAVLGTVTDSAGVRLPFHQVLTGTALVAAVMTLLMGIYARYPFALAAGLGLNAFVAFTLVGSLHLTWPEAMGVVVLEGLLITALVVTGLREAVLDAIPIDLKRAIGIGIGMFIALIGLVNAGLVVHPASGAPIVTMNPDLGSLRMLTFAVGLAATAALVARRVTGALLLGIVLTTILAIAINSIWGHGHLWAAVGPDAARFPERIIDFPDFGLLGRCSFGVFGKLSIAAAVAAIVSVMLSDFFDTMGTVVGIASKAGLLDARGKLPGIHRVLLVDSLAAVAGGAASVSSNTTYIESAAGVAEGGRTGLASVVTAALFMLALFLSPWAGVVPPEATAPILVLVGYFMMTTVGEIDWLDPGVGIPALLTIAMMPFTFSITNGVAAGFLAYTVIAVLRGRGALVHPLMYAVSAVFVWYLVRGLRP